MDNQVRIDDDPHPPGGAGGRPAWSGSQCCLLGGESCAASLLLRPLPLRLAAVDTCAAPVSRWTAWYSLIECRSNQAAETWGWLASAAAVSKEQKKFNRALRQRDAKGSDSRQR